MRLRPNPHDIHQPDPPANMSLLPLILQSSDIIRTNPHQFSTFQITAYPLAVINVPSLTSSTLMQSGLGGDAAGDISQGGKAGGTGVGCVGAMVVVQMQHRIIGRVPPVLLLL